MGIRGNRLRGISCRVFLEMVVLFAKNLLSYGVSTPLSFPYELLGSRINQLNFSFSNRIL